MSGPYQYDAGPSADETGRYLYTPVSQPPQYDMPYLLHPQIAPTHESMNLGEATELSEARSQTGTAPAAEDNEDHQEEEGSDEEGSHRKNSGRRKIRIEFIEDRARRLISFSKRRAGIMKKAYELSTLTGTQVLLIVASESGQVHTFATPSLQPIITRAEGKTLIQKCLNSGGESIDAAAPAEQSVDDGASSKVGKTASSSSQRSESSHQRQRATQSSVSAPPGQASHPVPPVLQQPDRYFQQGPVQQTQPQLHPHHQQRSQEWQHHPDHQRRHQQYTPLPPQISNGAYPTAQSQLPLDEAGRGNVAPYIYPYQVTTPSHILLYGGSSSQLRHPSDLSQHQHPRQP